jgi:hypothetical protein
MVSTPGVSAMRSRFVCFPTFSSTSTTTVSAVFGRVVEIAFDRKSVIEEHMAGIMVTNQDSVSASLPSRVNQPRNIPYLFGAAAGSWFGRCAINSTNTERPGWGMLSTTGLRAIGSA